MQYEMNKKEVSMFLTGVTSRLLYAQWSNFHEWTEERLGRPIWKWEFKLIDELEVGFLGKSISKEIIKTITDAEWREIADFFIESEIKAINKEALRTLCMKHDFLYGPQPGSYYEGLSVYNFYLEETHEYEITTNAKWMKKAKDIAEDSEVKRKKND